MNRAKLKKKYEKELPEGIYTIGEGDYVASVNKTVYIEYLLDLREELEELFKNFKPYKFEQNGH